MLDMNEEKISANGWDEYFINLLKPIASKSKDRTTTVGAIIVGVNNNILSTGFNGFPRYVNDDIEKRHERPEKYLWTEHAERNAIYNAAKHGIRLDESRIYIDWYPCADCARAIIQSGISEIIINGKDYEEKEEYWNERWKENFNTAKEMLNEAGIFITIFSNGDK